MSGRVDGGRTSAHGGAAPASIDSASSASGEAILEEQLLRDVQKEVEEKTGAMHYAQGTSSSAPPAPSKVLSVGKNSAPSLPVPAARQERNTHVAGTSESVPGVAAIDEASSGQERVAHTRSESATAGAQGEAALAEMEQAMPALTDPSHKKMEFPNLPGDFASKSPSSNADPLHGGLMDRPVVLSSGYLTERTNETVVKMNAAPSYGRKSEFNAKDGAAGLEYVASIANENSASNLLGSSSQSSQEANISIKDTDISLYGNSGNLEVNEIRNTVTYSLNGTLKQVARSYVESLIHYLNWNKLEGTEVCYDSVLGHGTSMFTTRPTGTFHYLLKHEKDGVSMINDGYTGWCYGFINSKGIWLFKPSDPLPAGYIHYVQHTGVTVLPREAVYSEIAPGGKVENIELGIEPIIEAVKDLATYDGSEDEKVLNKLMISVGRVVFPVCEGLKFNQVLELNANVIRRCIRTTVGESDKPEPAHYVQGWSVICTAANSSFFNFLWHGYPMIPFKRHKKFGCIRTVRQALSYVNLAPYMSVTERMCVRMKRKTYSWERADDGEGDKDICLLDSVDLSKFSACYREKFKSDTEHFLDRRVGGSAHWSVREFLDKKRPNELNPYRASLQTTYGIRIPFIRPAWAAKLARAIRCFKK